ncbi:phage major capsid family protein [Pseudomonas benzopyrenica]|uniref:phage major capsid family protein n=1 Tax=Pseudomonas benzopyrenica TaxID=2993566 RepID=UPI003F160B31
MHLKHEYAIARFVHALAKSMNEPVAAMEYARNRYGSADIATRMLTKAVASTGVLGDDPDFIAAGQAFVQLMKPRSLLAKIDDVSPFRRTPFNTRVLAQTTAPVAKWRREGQPIPVGAVDFDALARVQSLSLGAIVVMTNELLAGAGAGFEQAISAELVRAAAALEAESLLDPASAGEAGVEPASITNGINATDLSGAANTEEAVAALMDAYQGDLETAVLVTSPNVGIRLSMAEQPTGARGGVTFGVPHITSSAAPAGQITLLDPAAILLSDGGALVDLAAETTVEQEDGTRLSLWQNNLSAVRVLREVNWQRGSASAVAYGVIAE